MSRAKGVLPFKVAERQRTYCSRPDLEKQWPAEPAGHFPLRVHGALDLQANRLHQFQAIAGGDYTLAQLVVE